MRENKKFIITFCIILITILVTNIMVVIIVDPFQNFHKPLFGLKSVGLDQVYQNPGYAKMYDYEIAIIGTSMTEGIRASYVENVFEKKAIKLCESGAHTKDIAEILKVVCQSDKAETVIMGIDANIFRKEYDTYRQSYMPVYLYNYNLFDDYNYILNKQFALYDSTMMILKNLRGEIQDIDDYYISSDSRYSKSIALENNEKVRNSKPSMDWDRAEKNIDNIIPYIAENPDIEFYLFMPPYSVLFWENYYKNDCSDKELDMHRQIIEEFISYDNVKLFYFMNDEKIITNLDNYKDAGHYSPSICSELIDKMYIGDYLVTKENYLDVLEQMKNFVNNYNYEDIYEDK